MIVIANGQVSTYKEDANILPVAIDDFMAEIVKVAPIRIPFLPSCCKGFMSFPTYSTFIIEQAPRTQRIMFRPAGSEGPLFNFDLHFPWLYYLFTMQNKPLVVHSVGVVYGKERIKNDDSKLFFMETPNVLLSDNLGLMCLGKVRLDDNLTMQDCVDDLISKILGSEFNHDHFGAGNGNDLELIKAYQVVVTKNIDKKLAASKEIDEIEAFIFNKNGGWYNVLYLKAWEEMSKDLSIKKFLSKMEANRYFSYKQVLDQVTYSLGPR